MPVEVVSSPDRSFDHEAATHLRSAQAAMTDLLAGAGLTNARPTDLGRRLGVDKTLAWKVSRFVGSADPAKAVRHMPGAGGIEILVKAASSAGVAEALLARTRIADQELRTFVDKHAGDRRSFEAMLAGGGRDKRLEAEERKAYFRAGSTIWGVRARTQFLMLALAPSEAREGYMDVVQVSGLMNFERLRPDVPWIVRRLRAHSDSGAEVFDVVREPLDESRRAAGLPPLLSEFCSRPLPDLRQFHKENGWVFDELAPGPVGREGAVDVVLGERYIGAVSAIPSPDNTQGLYSLTMRTPVEGVLFDLLIHRDLANLGAAKRAVYGLLEDRPTTGVSPEASKPATILEPEDAHDLGNPAVVQTSRVPGYAPMIERCLQTAGFEGLSSFRGYRAELEYPAFPCDLKLGVDIS